MARLNFFGKRKEKVSESSYGDVVSILLDTQIFSKFNSLLGMDIPFDLSPHFILRAGAIKILGDQSNLFSSFTLEEFLEGKRMRLAELDKSINIALNELQEIRSAKATYANDEVIIEYRLEMLEKIVDRMRMVLENKSSDV